MPQPIPLLRCNCNLLKRLYLWLPSICVALEHTYHTKISSIEIQKIKKKEEIMWLVIFHLMYLRARQRDRLHSEPYSLNADK